MEGTSTMADPKRSGTGKGRGQTLGLLLTVVIACIMSVTYVDIKALVLSEEEEGGPKVADFSLRTVDGGVFRLSEHRGKVVIVDIMMVSCQACRYQAENLSKLQDLFSAAGEADRPVIVSIDIFDYDTDRMLLEFKNETGGQWPHAIDSSDEAQISLMPETIDPAVWTSVPIVKVIDRDGRLFAGFVGVTTASTLAETFRAAN